MPDEARLPTHLRASALLRQWNMDGMPGVMRQRGDDIAGTMIIAVDRCNRTSILLGEQRDLDGKRTWVALGSGGALGQEEEQAYLTKAISRDRDLWVLGVECRSGWPELDGPLDPALTVA